MAQRGLLTKSPEHVRKEALSILQATKEKTNDENSASEDKSKEVDMPEAEDDNDPAKPSPSRDAKP